MFAIEIIVITYIAQLSFAVELEQLQFYCDRTIGTSQLTAELILSKKLQCNPLPFGSDKYTCVVSIDEMFATGHIKLTNRISENTDAIIFHAKGDRSNVDFSKCYSCDTNKVNQPDNKLCNGQYIALDYALDLPSTCGGSGHTFEGGMDYYFQTFLPVNSFQQDGNMNFSLSDAKLGSLLNCKVEVELRKTL